MSKGKVLNIGKDWWKQDREAGAESLIVRKERKMPKKTYSVKELASIWSVTEDHITKAIRLGKLRAFAVGRIWRITDADWFAFLEQQTRRKGVG